MENHIHTHSHTHRRQIHGWYDHTWRGMKCAICVCMNLSLHALRRPNNAHIPRLLCVCVCRSQFDVYSFGLFYGHLYSRLALLLRSRQPLLIFGDATRDYRSELRTIPCRSFQLKCAIKYSPCIPHNEWSRASTRQVNSSIFSVTLSSGHNFSPNDSHHSYARLEIESLFVTD